MAQESDEQKTASTKNNKYFDQTLRITRCQTFEERLEAWDDCDNRYIMCEVDSEDEITGIEMLLIPIPIFIANARIQWVRIANPTASQEKFVDAVRHFVISKVRKQKKLRKNLQKVDL